jgi:YD repeat-containing protein
MKILKSLFPISPLILAISVSALSAFQPAKWEPMDPYITDPRPGGPIRLRVYDEAERLLEIAQYEYDTAGRLIGERYSRPDGTLTGSTHYIFEGGRLTREVLKNDSGATVTEKRFSYTDGVIRGSEVIQDGKVTLRHEYQLKEGRIVSGRELSGKESDRFTIAYQGDLPISLKFTDDSGKAYSEIVYRYDSEGRITMRSRIEEGSQRDCRYEYKNGKIASYQYFRSEGGKRIPEKRFVFDY